MERSLKFKDFFKDKNTTDAVLDCIQEILWDEGDELTLHIERLSHASKVIYLAETCEGQINNGGFDQFFWNSSGDFTLETIKALEEIGATKSVQLFNKATSWFPNSTPSADREARWKQLKVFEKSTAYEKLLDALDKEFYKYEDNIMALIDDYIKAHPDASMRA